MHNHANLHELKNKNHRFAWQEAGSAHNLSLSLKLPPFLLLLFFSRLLLPLAKAPLKAFTWFELKPLRIPLWASCQSRVKILVLSTFLHSCSNTVGWFGHSAILSPSTLKLIYLTKLQPKWWGQGLFIFFKPLQKLNNTTKTCTTDTELHIGTTI